MIRKYRSKTWAQKYADKLAARFPDATFEVRQHPYDFGWCVARIVPSGLSYCK